MDSIHFFMDEYEDKDILSLGSGESNWCEPLYVHHDIVQLGPLRHTCKE